MEMKKEPFVLLCQIILKTILFFSIIPQISSTKYRNGDHLSLKVGQMYLESKTNKHLGFAQAGFCVDDKKGGAGLKHNSIAESIFGLFISESTMKIKFGQNSSQMALCSGTIDFGRLNSFMQPENQSMFYDIYIDGIHRQSKIAAKIEKGSIHINTKKSLKIFINKNEIVDFRIEDSRLYPITREDSSVKFFFDVSFIPTSQTRNVPPEEQHNAAFKIVIVVLILCCVLAHFFFRRQASIMINNYQKFKQNYANNDADNGKNKWIKIEDYIYRPPKLPLLLSALLGSGLHILLACVVSSVFSLFFGLSGNVNSLLWNILISYACTSACNGFYSSRIYSIFEGKKWLINSLTSSLFIPAIYATALAIYSTSVGTVNKMFVLSFKNYISLFAYLVILVVPLNFAGALYSAHIDDQAVKFKSRKSSGQKQPILFADCLWQTLFFNVVVLTPFLSQLYFVYKTKWLDSYITVNLALIAGILLIISLIFSLILSAMFAFCWFNKGFYSWKWRSFFVGASIFIPLLIFSVLFYNNTNVHEMDNLAREYYLTTTFIWSLLISIYYGFVSFSGAHFTVSLLYGNS